MDGKETKRKGIVDQFVVWAVVEFVALAFILSIIGAVVYDKMDILLIESLKESVAQQSQSIAYSLGERFQHKLDELESRAELVQRREISAEDAVEIATIGTRDGRMRGILRKDNSAIVGKPLPEAVFKSLGRIWQGQRVIGYYRGIGLVFAVPFELDGEVCVFFEVFDDDSVQNFYRMISYNEKGTLILAAPGDNWLLLSKGQYPEMTAGRMPNFNEAWKEVEHPDLAHGKTYSSYLEDVVDNELYGFFFHSTYISEKDNLILSGYVEWDDVVVGIDYIYTLMRMVFFIVLALLFVVICYNMRTQQLRYSEHQTALSDSANQAKSDFLSRMSHEIRTPINAIMGMDEMILRESKDPATLEYAQNLQHAARSLLEIINDILDFSRIEAGKMEIIPVEYLLSSLLNDIINMIQKRAEKKGLEVHVEATRSIPNALYGDEVRIKQIVTNLLTNAVKYTERGSITLKVGYHSIDENHISLHVSVSDTGIGIKKEDIAKLFCSFERIEEKRNRNIEGTGLGMNISTQLLSMMGSELKVKSVYGKGSTFSFQIEQQVMNPEPLGDFEEAYRHSLSRHKEYQVSFRAPEARLLVVDDTVMNLTVVKGLLKQTRIQIDTALSGRECLKAVQKKKYDIIFLDHMMPGMDGIETLHAMKTLEGNKNLETPVISLTANAIRGARDQYIAAGFQDYLTKPINCGRLEEMIARYLPPEKVLADDGTKQEAPAEQEEAVSLPQWLCDTAGLDIRTGIEHCGSEAAYIDVLTVFANSVAMAAKEIEGYFQEEDWKNYTTKVHALKSTAKIIGAAELSEKARRLEDAGSAGYIDEIRQDHRPLMELYLSYGEKLQPLVAKEEDDADKPPIDETELSEAIEAMGDIAATFDYDSLQFLFESLDGYRLPETEAALYREIKEAAAKPDWERINELLQEFKR